MAAAVDTRVHVRFEPIDFFLFLFLPIFQYLFFLLSLLSLHFFLLQIKISIGCQQRAHVFVLLLYLVPNHKTPVPLLIHPDRRVLTNTLPLFLLGGLSHLL